MELHSFINDKYFAESDNSLSIRSISSYVGAMHNV